MTSAENGTSAENETSAENYGTCGTAVVTGAASGVGQEVANRLLAAGYAVIGVDRNKPQNPGIRWVHTDLADTASIDSAARELTGTPIDVVVNSAGVPGTVADKTVFQVNFLGLRRLTEAVLSEVKPRGLIVNIASVAGYGPGVDAESLGGLIATEDWDAALTWLTENMPDGVPAYHFSKQAVIFYTQCLATRSLDRGIRVIAVSPGPVETPLLKDFEDSMGKEHLDWVRSLVGRHATVDDVADVVDLLLLPQAKWLNGISIAVDGGVIAAMSSGLVENPGLESR